MKYNIGQKIYAVDKECAFCTNSFDHCDFGCNRHNCFIIKGLKVIQIVVTERNIDYYCIDDEHNGYKFQESDENIFETPQQARNELAEVISSDAYVLRKYRKSFLKY